MPNIDVGYWFSGYPETCSWLTDKEDSGIENPLVDEDGTCQEKSPSQNHSAEENSSEKNSSKFCYKSSFKKYFITSSVPEDQPSPHLNGSANGGEEEEFTEADRETVRNAFHLFDTVGNGKISVDELGNLLRALGQNPTEEQVEELLGVNSA